MPRHATAVAPTLGDATPLDYRIPAYYLTGATGEHFLAVLLDLGMPLPVAHGVRLDSYSGGTCEACRDVGCDAWVEDVIGYGEGVEDRTPWHLTCLAGGDHLGIVPTCYLDLFDAHDGLPMRGESMPHL